MDRQTKFQFKDVEIIGDEESKGFKSAVFWNFFLELRRNIAQNNFIHCVCHYAKRTNSQIKLCGSRKQAYHCESSSQLVS